MSKRPLVDEADLEVRNHYTKRATRSQVARELQRGARPAVLVALLLVIALAATFAVWRNVSGGVSPLAGSYTVKVAVPDASGVVAGVQEVRISGVAVGRVRNIAIEDGRAVATLSIRRSFGRIYRDARIRVRPQTPLNDVYFNVVDRGSERAGELGSAQPLAAERTEVPVQVGDVLNTFQAPTRDRIQQFLDQVGPALGDNGRQLRQAFAELTPFLRASAKLSDELLAQKTATRRLVHNVSLMLAELGSRGRALRGVVGHGQRTFTAVAANAPALDATLQTLPTTLEQARATFGRLGPTLVRLRSALIALKPAADELPDGLKDVKSLSDDAQPALTRLRPTVARLRPFVATARPLAGQLQRSFSALQPGASRLDGLLAQLPPCEAAFRNFFTDTLSVFKFANAEHTYPRGELTVNLPGQLTAPSSCAKGGPQK